MLLTLLLLVATPAGCTSPRSQVDMTRCAGLAYTQADAEMTAQWHRTQAYMKRRDARDTSRGGGFGHAAALLDSQRAWLRYRDPQCVVEGGRYASGSAQPMVRAQCLARLTTERTAQLRALITG